MSSKKTATVDYFPKGTRLWVCDADDKVKEVVVLDVSLRVTPTGILASHHIDLPTKQPYTFNDPILCHVGTEQLYDTHDDALAEQSARRRRPLREFLLSA